MESQKKKSLSLIVIIFIGLILISIILFIVNSAVIKEINADNENIAKQEMKENLNELNNKDKYFLEEIDVPKEPTIVNLREDSKNELLFKDAKIDNEKLFIKLELKTLGNKIINPDKIWTYIDGANIEIGNEIYRLDYDTNIFEITKIEENLYEIYLVYDARGIDYNRNVKFSLDLYIDEDISKNDEDYKINLIGEWKIEFAIVEEMKTNSNEKYALKDLNLVFNSEKGYEELNFKPELKISSVRMLNDYIVLGTILNNYTTEDGCIYQLKVVDEENNSLLINEKINLIGGTGENILLKKFDLDSNIKMQLIKANKYSNKSENLGENSVKIVDYKTEIIQEESNNEKHASEYVEFVMNTNQWYVSKNNAFDEIDINNLKHPIHLMKKNNTENVFDVTNNRNIAIRKLLNEKNESIEKIFETRKKLLELGFLNEREEYAIDIKINENSEYKTYLFSHEELMRISDGETIIKDEEEFTKDKIQKYNDVESMKCYYQNPRKIMLNGREAFTYIHDAGEIFRVYLLKVNDITYEIDVPQNLALKNEINKIVDSIVFK